MGRRIAIACALVLMLRASSAPAEIAPLEFHVVDLNFEIPEPAFFSITRATSISNGVAVGLVSESGPRSYSPSPVAWPNQSAQHTILSAPAGASALATGVSHGEIVGRTAGWELAFGRALLWTGPQHQLIDLHPSGFALSTANGVSGNRQVGAGVADSDGKWHALLWNASAESVIDLGGGVNDITSANAVDANHEAGVFEGHAALWSGSAGSRVDLHPAGYDRSEALAVAGDRQVGFAVIVDESFNTTDHAIVWHGSAGSAAALNTGAFDQAHATGIADEMIVGAGWLDENLAHRALLWRDESATPLSLHDLLPESLRGGESRAWGIDPETGIIAGEASGHAVLWVPGAASVVPLPLGVYPDAIGLLLCITPGILRRRRR